MSTRKSKERRLPNLYGYMLNPDTGEMEIEPEEAKAIKYIFSKFLMERQPIYRIASLMNQPYGFATKHQGAAFSATLIGKILKRPQYCGFWNDNENNLIPSSIYPAIITHEEWKEVQAGLKLRLKKMRGSSGQIEYPLSGFLGCGSCPKKYYIKCKTRNKKYYLHNDVCQNKSTLMSISENYLKNVVDMIFIETFTSIRYLESKLGMFKLISWNSAENKPCDYIYPESAKKILLEYLCNLKNSYGSGNISIEKDVEEIITNSAITNEWFSDLFAKSIKATLEEWFSGKLSSKFDLTMQYFNYLKIKEDCLIVSLINETDELELNLKKLPQAWGEKLQVYISHKDLFSKEPKERKRLLKELTDYLDEKLKTINKNIGKELASIAKHYIEDNIPQSRQLANSPLKVHFYVSDYWCIFDTQLRFEKLHVYKLSNTNKCYAKIEEEKWEEIFPFDHDGQLIAFLFKNKIFYNVDFLHRLPEWFYGYNYEYFKTDIGKICFIQSNDTIQAIKIGRKGIKQSNIEILGIIKDIRFMKKFLFVDID